MSDASLAGARRRCAVALDVGDCYRAFRRQGLEYGEAFQGIDALWRTEGEALARLRPTEPVVIDEGAFALHPAVLDVCFQVLLVAARAPWEVGDDAEPFIPVGVDAYEARGQAGAGAWCHAAVRGRAQEGTLVGDITVFDPAGAVLAVVEGARLRLAPRTALRPAGKLALYGESWEHAAPGSDAVAGRRRVLFLDKERQPPDGRAIIVVPGTGFDRVSPSRFVIDPDQSTDYGRVLKEVRAAEVDQIVYLVGDGGSDPTVGLERTCGRLLLLVQALAASAWSGRAGLWVVTRRAQTAAPDEAPAPEQAAVWGLGRVVGLELPELGLRLVDLSMEDTGDLPSALLAELASPGADREIRLHGAGRLVRRLVPLRIERDDRAALSGRLEVQRPGDLDSLTFVPAPLPGLAAGEVELEVRAAGLNFRDVLVALDMYPGPPFNPGGECSGVVAAVGERVSGIEVGDEVIASPMVGCFAHRVRVPASLVAPKPPALSFEAAATVPIVFLTAHYCLERLAGLRPAERVLVHAGAGGVGLAAVQLAQRAGAEVFTTAGSDEKREHLRALGVDHVFDSRSLAFAEEIRSITGGHGVDVLLNSLSGELIDASLSCLGEGGRFVEIGKTGIWSRERMAAARGDVRYHILALDELARTRPEEVGAALRELAARFEAGDLVPLPVKVFAAAEAGQAFRYMQQARQIGKVCLRMRAAGDDDGLRAEATYLVTGALGSLGRLVVEALVQAGARHLALLDLRATDAEARGWLEALAARGARAKLYTVDLARREDLAQSLANVASELPPLRGVFHLAGVLDDGVLTDQSWQRFARVLAPKAVGAWHLHELTRDLPLECFVLFSSAVSFLGWPGQGNYAAANAFLDGLARLRRAAGLPGLSINWGPFGEVGMAAVLGEREERRWRERGLRYLQPDRALSLFSQLVEGAPAAQVAALDADWARVQKSLRPDAPQLFERLVRAGPERPVNGFLAGLGSAGAPADRRAWLEEQVRQHVIRVLGLDGGADVGAQTPLKELGIDSLTAIELRSTLGRSIGRNLPATLAFDHPSIEALAGYLERELSAVEPPRPTREASRAAAGEQPIAVVGIGCRLPGAVRDAEALWDLLRDGQDAIIEVPPDRWDADALYDPDPSTPGKTYARWGGFIGGVDRFDAAFFGISPREAQEMDPQQRLLLEVAWEALEDAGRPAASLPRGETGVFVGITNSDYLQLRVRSAGLDGIDAHTSTGTNNSVAAGRLSYFLGLQGPSLAIDTACSSSLVAIHLACQSLRRGECRAAIAGGINLMLAPDTTIAFSKTRMLAPDGRCKTFDAAADGYVRGEGCGLLVLKPLEDARRDGDRVLGLIRGTAVNQDGRSSGITAPNGPAQAAVIRAALADAGLRPEEVGYVEAHGTGTTLGDPIEVQALAEVYGAGRPAGRWLAVGSIKTNIGHLESAAGVAGLIKVLVALHEREIPPTLNLRRLNPHIVAGNLPIVFPTSLTPWSTSRGSRVGAVSSFGFSGTNAHVLVEEAPPAPVEDTATEDVARVLCLSARQERALSELTTAMALHLADRPQLPVQEVARTLSAGRTHFEHRLAVVASTLDEARSRLEAAAVDGPKGFRGVAPSRPPGVAFLFPADGRGVGLDRALYERSGALRGALDRCRAPLEVAVGDDPLAILLGDAPLPTEQRRLQPLLVAQEIALAELWRSLGVEPTAVFGAGAGEIAAACVAGALGPEQAIELARARGEIVDAVPDDGAMAVVFCGEPRALRAIAGHADQVSVAGLLGHGALLLAGARPALSEVLRALDGVRSAVVHGGKALGSPLVEPLLPRLQEVGAGLSAAPPTVRLVSGLTGSPVRDEVARAGHWRRLLREPLQLEGAAKSLVNAGCRVFLEVGWGSLLPLVRRATDERGLAWLTTGPGLEPALARMYVAGVDLAWERIHGRPAQKLSLPRYPFQGQRYWLQAHAGRPALPAGAAGLVDRRLDTPKQTLFEGQVSARAPAFLPDHRVGEQVVVPGAAMLWAAVTAAGRALGREAVALEGVELQRALVPRADEVYTVQTSIELDGSRFLLHSRRGATWTLHARGQIGQAGPVAAGAGELEAARSRCTSPVQVDLYYQRLWDAGLRYSGMFKGLRSLERGVDEALAEIEVKPGTGVAHAHPALVDAGFQALLGAALGEEAPDRPWVPVSLERYVSEPTAASRLWCHAEVTERSPEAITGRVSLFDEQGRCVVIAEGARLQRVQASALVRDAELPPHVCRVVWSPRPLAAGRADAGGTWLVLADRTSALGADVRALLEARGGRCLLVAPGDDYHHAEVGALRGVLHLWAMGDVAPDLDLLGEQVARYGSALEVCKAFLGRAPVWLVTRGGQPAGEGPLSLAPSTLWGLGRAVAREHPDAAPVRLDLDPEAPTGEAGALVDEILDGSGEPEVAFRAGVRLVRRLEEIAREGEGDARRLVSPAPGLDALQLAPRPRRRPGPGEVEIRVRATALNFRDVLLAMGLYPGGPRPLGVECSGDVVAVGPGEPRFRVGDRVVTFQGGNLEGCFASHVTVRRELVAAIPEALEHEQAAAMPGVFLTARIALVRRAALGAGETVLIHGAAGGVGQAAIQVARGVGARIVGTEGSPEKRAMLKELGVDQSLDVEADDFVEQVRALTNGRGVDVVLNFLTGELLERSLAVLGEGGRFVEIGKRGILTPQELAERRPDVAYHVLAVDQLTEEQPALIGEELALVMADLEGGLLRALPVERHGIERVASAFGRMQRAQHVGKIVVGWDRSPVQGDGSYLLTGGLGGLGRRVARWLVEQGARDLVLMEIAPPDAAARELVDELGRAGARVRIERGDVSRLEDVQRVLAGAPASVRGVFHLAGALDDGVLAEQSWDRFVRVFSPKAIGAWNLHLASQELELDHFVMFSSIAGLLGSPGQASYAAANVFQDQLAHHRRRRGLAALSVAWGPWGEAGMAAGLGSREERRWNAKGVGYLAPDEALEELGRLLVGDAPHVGVLRCDFATLVRSGAADAALLTELVGPAPSAAPTAEPELVRRLSGVAPGQAAKAAVRYLQEVVARILAVSSPDAVDVRGRLMEMGVDSLLAVELRNSLSGALDRPVPATLIFDYPTIETIARFITDELLADRTTTVAGEAPEAAPDDLEEVKGMTQEEVEALLAAELDDLPVK